jgi:hypothetical protein
VSDQNQIKTNLKTYRGGCHCKAVRFEVDAAEKLDVLECTCSICSMTGFLHLIVPRNQFRLLQGESELTRYQFNTGVAQHLFCRICGIKSFYIPRSNPNGVDINIRCIDTADLGEVKKSLFDGANWEQHAAGLAHLSM